MVGMWGLAEGVAELRRRGGRAEGRNGERAREKEAATVVRPAAIPLLTPTPFAAAGEGSASVPGRDLQSRGKARVSDPAPVVGGSARKSELFVGMPDAYSVGVPRAVEVRSLTAVVTKYETVIASRSTAS
jgi:hypothetical protein